MRHEKSHGPPKYWCTFCGKGFKRKGFVTVHNKNVNCTKPKKDVPPGPGPGPVYDMAMAMAAPTPTEGGLPEPESQGFWEIMHLLAVVTLAL